MIIKFKAKWDQTDFFGSFVTLWLKFGALFDNFNASDVVAKNGYFLDLVKLSQGKKTESTSDEYATK